MIESRHGCRAKINRRHYKDNSCAVLPIYNSFYSFNTWVRIYEEHLHLGKFVCLNFILHASLFYVLLAPALCMISNNNKNGEVTTTLIISMIQKV